VIWGWNATNNPYVTAIAAIAPVGAFMYFMNWNWHRRRKLPMPSHWNPNDPNDPVLMRHRRRLAKRIYSHLMAEQRRARV
jgi:hypothetical protein